MKAISFTECLNFILKYRGQSTFVDWTYEEILNELQRHINNDTVIMTGKEYDNGARIFTGLILFDIHEYGKTLHINHIICIEKEAFKSFIEIYKNKYSKYKIAAFRRGNFKRYSNTTRLISKLSHKLFYV